MSAGFRDLLALLLGWKAAPRLWQTAGPYRLAVGQTFCAGAAAGGMFHAGPAAAITSGGNVVVGQCNG